jgi:hypothetical protein
MYYSGGYYLIEQLERPSCMNSDIVPSMILSISPCICNTYPDGFNWYREQRPPKFNEEMAKDCEEWMSTKLDDQQIGWPNVFYDLKTAREFYRRFLFSLPNLRCIGIGLKAEFVKDFLDYLISYQGGVVQCLMQKRFLEEGGKFLGFEVLGYDTCVLHSYLCNGLEEELPQFAISLNSEGLITNFKQAVEFAESLSNRGDELEVDYYCPWVLYECQLPPTLKGRGL